MKSPIKDEDLPRATDAMQYSIIGTVAYILGTVAIVMGFFQHNNTKMIRLFCLGIVSALLGVIFEKRAMKIFPEGFEED